MEDDLNILVIRRHLIFFKWKTTSIVELLEDNQNLLASGRRCQLFVNGRQLQILYRKYKSKINIRKNSLSYAQLELSLAQLSPSLSFVFPMLLFQTLPFARHWFWMKQDRRQTKGYLRPIFIIVWGQFTFFQIPYDFLPNTKKILNFKTQMLVLTKTRKLA